MGHSPGIDADMMIAGSLNVDYAAMQVTADKLVAACADARTIHVTTVAGTALELGVTHRPFVCDLRATVEHGANLPCGEVFCAPVETAAEGTLVVDSCAGSYGVVPSPVTMSVAAGRVTTVACADEKIVGMINSWLDTDGGARNIAELGIGLNPGARLTSRMLEAEKALGTAHIAFGCNEGMPGGQGHSQMHVDYLFHRATVVVTAADKAQTTLLDNGEFLSV
jgi:leucyl aminopeptidase (aminopeptidase T)